MGSLTYDKHPRDCAEACATAFLGRNELKDAAIILRGDGAPALPLTRTDE
jgi:hypothetical protein